MSVPPARAAAVHGEADAVRAVPSAIDAKMLIGKWAAHEDRLYAVAAPLLVKNAEVCKKKTRLIPGFVAKTKYFYSEKFADAAESELGLSDRMRVTHVMPGGAAEKAGVRRGDMVVSIGGRKLPSGPGAEKKALALMDDAMQGKNRIALTVRRGDNELALDIPLMRACAFDVELGNTQDVNAYSDGRRSLITSGMMDFARTDAELAIVAAKEIAHNIVMLRPRPNIVSTIDDLRGFDLASKTSPSATKIRPYTAVTDATADKYSLYLLARAGHDVDKALPFWKRLAGQFPAAQTNSHTALHPSTAYRFSVIAAVTGVVKHHLKHRLALMPH